MSDFDYKKYSLQKLEDWVCDAIGTAEASPQEIYDTIKKVVQEQYYYHKNHTSRTYELLALLNGNGKGDIEAFDAVMREREYYEPSMPPWGHSDMEYLSQYSGSTVSSVKYTDEELDSMCDKAASDQLPPQQEYLGWKDVSSGEFDKMFPKRDKVKKWVLPVQQSVIDGTDDYYVNFPNDLLEAADLKEGDQVEWIDQGDGSYLLKKKDA